MSRSGYITLSARPAGIASAATPVPLPGGTRRGREGNARPRDQPLASACDRGKPGYRSRRTPRPSGRPRGRHCPPLGPVEAARVRKRYLGRENATDRHWETLSGVVVPGLLTGTPYRTGRAEGSSVAGSISRSPLGRSPTTTVPARVTATERSPRGGRHRCGSRHPFGGLTSGSTPCVPRRYDPRPVRTPDREDLRSHRGASDTASRRGTRSRSRGMRRRSGPRR